jgi:hypothetical protein
MNYIKQLTGFFERVSNDERLNPTHVSLYMSLFQYWNINRFQNPISITRHEVMRISKIYSKATYHKCMRELHTFGYLRYEPSYNPFRGSLVHLEDFAPEIMPATRRSSSKNNQAKKQTSTEQVLDRSCTGTVPINEPSINCINLLNINREAKNENQEKKKESSLNDEHVVTGSKKKGSAAKFSVPPLPEIEAYFLTQNAPVLEASRFFNYFESNGWLVGGRTQMKDWKAAARNWLLNSHKFKAAQDPHARAGHLQTPIAKNYGEPL